MCVRFFSNFDSFWRVCCFEDEYPIQFGEIGFNMHSMNGKKCIRSYLIHRIRFSVANWFHRKIESLKNLMVVPSFKFQCWQLTLISENQIRVGQTGFWLILFTNSVKVCWTKFFVLYMWTCPKWSICHLFHSHHYNTNWTTIYIKGGKTKRVSQTTSSPTLHYELMFRLH